MRENIKARRRVESPSLMQIERDFNNPATIVAIESLGNIYNIPIGAFSGVATYKEGEEEKRLFPEPIHDITIPITKEEGDKESDKKIKVTMDGVIAEQFTNYRYIVRELNNIGPITTKDPREKYEGQIDALIDKTTKDLEEFKKATKAEWQSLEERKGSGAISEFGYNKAVRLITDAQEIYNILIQELELKKRGFVFLGKGENAGEDIKISDDVKTNIQIEIKYLPGGGFVVLRGYAHHKDWQENFGDCRKHGLGLADIYSKAKYIAIEGSSREQLGDSLELYWAKCTDEDYDRLMKELIRNGFSGRFLELDSRYDGGKLEKTFEFNFLLSAGVGAKDLSYTEVERIFAYIRKINPHLAREIGTAERLLYMFHEQTTFSLVKRGLVGSLAFVKGGTRYHNGAFVNQDMSTSSIPTGFELGQVAFSDALSVIKILIMNEAMQTGELEPGIIVDFQGTDHLSYKSYFFDNPSFAMEVVLTNIHELLASHPNVRNREGILNKLENMDKDTWKWVFDFIGTIPFAKPAKPTLIKRSVEKGLFQRPMQRVKPYIVTKHLSSKQANALRELIKNLSLMQARK